MIKWIRWSEKNRGRRFDVELEEISIESSIYLHWFFTLFILQRALFRLFKSLNEKIRIQINFQLLIESSIMNVFSESFIEA